MKSPRQQLTIPNYKSWGHIQTSLGYSNEDQRATHCAKLVDSWRPLAQVFDSNQKHRNDRAQLCTSAQKSTRTSQCGNRTIHSHWNLDPRVNSQLLSSTPHHCIPETDMVIRGRPGPIFALYLANLSSPSPWEMCFASFATLPVTILQSRFVLWTASCILRRTLVAKTPREKAERKTPSAPSFTRR